MPSSKLTHRKKRLLQNHDTLGQWIQQLLNLLVVSLSLYGLAIWRDGEFREHYYSMLAFAILLMMITYRIMGVFRRFDKLEGAIQRLARAWGTVVIILAWTGFLTRSTTDYSRQVIVYWVVLAFIGQIVFIALTYCWFKVFRSRVQQQIPAIIVGTGNLAKHLAFSIKRNIWLNDTVVGVVHHNLEPTQWDLNDIPLLGTEQELERIIQEYNVRRVYIALPLSLTHLVKDVHNRVFEDNLDIVWAPDIFEFQLINHSVREVSGVPLMNLSETPLMAGGPAFIKSVMDKTIALIMIILLSPLLLAIAIAVRLNSPGPIIFKQERDGWDGQTFNVYKFRSMYAHREDNVVKQAQKNDSRITSVGRFIRRTSLDELPQLFNALEGTMSLVGPRPHAVSHNIFYSDKVKTYLARHRIKPGITGLAQISGFRGETETVEAMEKRVEYDLEYISNWSPWLDIKILFLTPFRLISKRGNAY